MRLGIGFHLFDGEELLEQCIQSIRKMSDYITVVYQLVSNRDTKTGANLKSLLINLKDRDLIDNFIFFKPEFSKGVGDNVIIKRNIGLDDCRKNACSHFITMDVDEFYLHSELEYAKKEMEIGNYDSSVCQMCSYYKFSYYRLEPKETYFVPLIYKIRDGVNLSANINFPVFVDTLRKMEPGKFRKFARNEIEMHHMSYIRRNIRYKLESSNSLASYKDKIDKIVNDYEKWNPKNKNLKTVNWAGRKLKVIKVKDLFNIKI